MKIYLCDDEDKILEDLKQKVYEIIPDSIIDTYNSGRDLIKALENEVCDILLLDIDMPEITGMDVARWLSNSSKRPLLIFVTSHDELVYESFQYHPFGFVRKGFLELEIKKILEDCTKAIESDKRYFNFRSEGKDFRLLLSDIRYFEAEGNYLKLHTKGEEYRFRSTVTAIENSFSNQGFIRIHKGFLVNQSAVKMISSDETQLLDGDVLPMGKTYAEDARKSFMRYMR